MSGSLKDIFAPDGDVEKLEKSDDCFDRHKAAVIKKQADLRRRGITRYAVPVSINDPDLERECFVDFHRRLIDKLNEEGSQRIWRIKKGNFSEEGFLETSASTYKGDEVIETGEGEFLIALIWKKNGVFCMPEPPQVNLSHIGKNSDLSVFTGGISNNPAEYLNAVRKKNQEILKEQKVTYRNHHSGKIQEELIHGIDCEDCMTKLEDKGKILKMDRSQAADSAFLTDLYLQEPLDFLESLEGDLKDTVARCFEQVYHAGKHSVRSFSPKAFMTESAYEMEDGQNRKKPRKQWTAKALNFFKEKGREAKWWEVLEHLREKNIAHWEGGDGGNCEVRDTQVITFEDGETEDKSRRQFQNALTKLRKKIPPKAKG